MKNVFWPLTIILTALLATMVGCSRQPAADRSAQRPASQAASSSSTEKSSASSVAAPAEVPANRARVGTPSPVNPPRRAGSEIEVTVPAGTSLGVRLDSAVSSKQSHVEDSVEATLIRPLTIGKREVLPAGSRIKGDVVAVEPAGTVKGRARLLLRFRTLTARGESYPIVAQISRIAPATKKKDAEKVGLPAVGGAIVGAIVGGKKGAAVGAAAGAGAGTAVVLATPGQEVTIPKGSILGLTLRQRVVVKVPPES